MVERIVSGGQTGADRAALDWAIARGIAHGGWCPIGRRAEDGVIGDSYVLKETAEQSYLVRTEQNVVDSDGTVVFSIGGELTGGSLATVRFAKLHQRPWLHVSKTESEDPSALLRQFLADHAVRILNVAGPRASGEPEIGVFVGEVLEQSLGHSEVLQ